MQAIAPDRAWADIMDTRRPAKEETIMPISSKYLYVVSMDVEPDKEALFNEVYDTEHVPNILKVPGVRAATRMAGEPFTQSIGGEEEKKGHDGPRYTAMYEIDSPPGPPSPAWEEAAGAGPRPRFGRPPTPNRKPTPYKV